MRRRVRSLEDAADLAGITVDELLELASTNPRLSEILKGYPQGIPPSGIPLTPSEFDSLWKAEDEE
jgi:hypothetical protein